MTGRLGMIALAALLGGCLDTPIEATTVALSVAGTEAPGPHTLADGTELTLSRADLAFGPLVLCAGVTAGALCDEALAEWRDAVVVDALDPVPRALDDMDALTGTVRSYMYDHGIVSLLTQDALLITDAAASLDGASVVLEGRAERDGQTLPFTIATRVQQSADVEQGVPVVRSGAGDGVDHRLAPDGGTALTVRFDPSTWLSRARFADLFEDAACAPGRDVACAGSIEQRCDEVGALIEERDCAALDQACLVSVGCTERLDVALPGDTEIEPPLARALRIALEAGTRPTLEFSGP